MKGSLLLIPYLLLRSLDFLAQDQLNELTVDRPGIAESPFTVAPHTYQFETGFDYYKRTSGEIYFLPVSLFRTGLSKAAELRISIKNIYDKTTEQRLKGLSPLTNRNQDAYYRAAWLDSGNRYPGECGVSSRKV